MNCPKCQAKMRKVQVKIQDAKNLVSSYQCPKCSYFDFEEASVKKAISEIREKESILKLKQKIIKLSQDRLGMYINKDVARSLNLKGGEDIYISIPGKNRLVIDIVS